VQVAFTDLCKLAPGDDIKPLRFFDCFFASFFLSRRKLEAVETEAL
jgi:hypothetical protein